MSAIKRFIASVLLLALPLPLLAQDNEKKFFIEEIEIRGTRFAPASVIERETLIKKDVSYTETAFEDATHRINRLPFVLDSTYALENGSEEGKYLLVINVTETKPLFVDAQSYFTRFGDLGTHGEEAVQSGVRYFLGGSSLVHASTDFDENYEVGLTQYNLFGHAGFASLRIRWTENDFDSSYRDPVTGGNFRFTTESEPAYEVAVAVPIFGNHSIDGYVDHQTSESTRIAPAFSDVSRQKASSGRLEWKYDSTDDPAIPSDGSMWGTGTYVSRFSQDVETVGEPDYPFGDYGFESRQLFTYIAHYFPITRHQSLMAGASYGLSWNDFGTAPNGQDLSDEMNGGMLQAGVTSALWPHSISSKFGDLRFEARGAYAFGPDANGFHTAEASVLQRNVWGAIRLSFYYNDSDYGLANPSSQGLEALPALQWSVR
jgi:outer membrane protein assembly factor BamA